MSIVRRDFRSELSGEKGESMNTVLEKIRKMGIVPVVVIENEKKRGQIQITKTSEDKNNIIDKEEGSPIEGVKFNIYNKANKIVDTIVTDENGVALSKKLEKGRYTVQEVETEKWYILDEKIYNVEIKENNEIIMLDITNKSKDPKVEITKSCKNITKTNDEIDYSFEIKNTGNVELEDFTWYDYLPTEYAKITGIETGTYNKDIIYNIYYKTNLLFLSIFLQNTPYQLQI